ncbi:unnamed protein product [Victoria cruziana]
MAARSVSLIPFSCLPLSKLGSRNECCSVPFLRFEPNNEFLGKCVVAAENQLVSVRKRRPSTAVYFMLPTAKPERDPTNSTPKWSARAIKSFTMAELEARKLKYPNTGTEALLMGILVEGTSFASKFLRSNGITLFKVREETITLLGKSDMYFFSPEHPPLTDPAQRALDWAVDEKIKSGKSGEVTVTHLLLGIWSEKDSAGHKILALLGFDDNKAEDLAASMNGDVALSAA